MDRVFSVDRCTRDGIIMSWMHTYSGFDNEWIDESGTQNDRKQSVLSGKLIHVQTMQSDRCASCV